MEDIPKREAFIAFAGQDLSTVKSYLKGVMGSWNGEDSQFLHEGEIFHEDDVSAAQEIVEKIDELQEMFDNFTD